MAVLLVLLAMPVGVAVVAVAGAVRGWRALPRSDSELSLTPHD